MDKLTLYYENNEEYKEVPSIFNYYFSLGQNVAFKQYPDKRIVVGVALPVRAYAASFSAVGAIVNRAAIKNNHFSTCEKEKFEYLCQLKIGTPLVYKINNREYKAIFDGTQEVLNEKRIKIILTNKDGGHLTEFLNASKAYSLSTTGTMDLKLPKEQKGRKVVSRDKFIRRVFGDLGSFKFIYSSSLESIIIGSVGVLKNEIVKTDLYVKADRKYIKGTLQDILRVKKFQSDSKTHKADVISASNKKNKTVDQKDVPPVVVFDGANSFINQRGYWYESNWIVFLEHTELRFSEAIEILNQSYYKRLSDTKLRIEHPIPPGVEIIVYEERKI